MLDLRYFRSGHSAVQRVNNKTTEHSTTELYHHLVGLMASIFSEVLTYECPSGAVSVDRLCQIFLSNNSLVHHYFIVSGWASINADGTLNYKRVCL